MCISHSFYLFEFILENVKNLCVATLVVTKCRAATWNCNNFSCALGWQIVQVIQLATAHCLKGGNGVYTHTYMHTYIRMSIRSYLCVYALRQFYAELIYVPLRRRRRSNGDHERNGGISGARGGNHKSAGISVYASAHMCVYVRVFIITFSQMPAAFVCAPKRAHTKQKVEGKVGNTATWRLRRSVSLERSEAMCCKWRKSGW